METLKTKNLITPEKLPDSFDETLNFLQKRMARLRYNQLNFLSHNCTFEKGLYGKIIIKNFYRNPKYPNAGTCHELSDALFLELINLDFVKGEDKIYKHFKTVLRATGKDKYYFNEDGCTHSFILVSEKQIPAGYFSSNIAIEVRNYPPIKSFVENYCHVVDPSFSIVKPFKESGYVANEIWGEKLAREKQGKRKTPEEKDCILQPGRFVPIAFLENADLWYIGNDLTCNQIHLARKKIHSKKWMWGKLIDSIESSWDYYPLNSAELSEILNPPIEIPPDVSTDSKEFQKLLQKPILARMLTILQKKVHEMEERDEQKTKKHIDDSNNTELPV